MEKKISSVTCRVSFFVYFQVSSWIIFSKFLICSSYVNFYCHLAYLTCMQSESEVTQSCLTLCDPVAYQAPLSMGFSRQWYWSGLPFPSPGDLPNPGIEPGLPNYRQTLYHLSHQGEMLGWMKHKLESRFPGEIAIASDMQMTSPLWQKEKKN